MSRLSRMETQPRLEALIISDDPVLSDRWRKLFASAPDILPLFARSLGEALRVLSSQSIGCIVVGGSVRGLTGMDLPRLLAELVPGIPLFLHRRGPAFLVRREIKRARLTGRVRPLAPPLVLDLIRSPAGHAPPKTFRERLLFSPSHTDEKLLVMQTSLDLLSHDTRDLFTRIYAILSDIPDGDYTGILTDYMNELFECTSEALGYMSAQKRIEPLIDIVNSIKTGREKIPLPSQSRIELVYGPRKLLFIETSRLVKYALGNIIDNALKYSPPDAKVRVEIARREGAVWFRVIDRGIGIPEAERPRIFERHFRSSLSRGYEGEGKGLWIAANIVREENGEISAEHRPGGGTIFTVRLPAFSLNRSERGLSQLCDWFKLPAEVVEKKARIMKTILLLEFPEHAADMESLAFTNLLDHFRDERKKKERQKYFYKLQEYTQYNPNGPRVLLVDDSLYVHYTIAPILADEGFRIVDFAFNGVEAYNLYQIFNPELVVMDITMPVKSGVETARDIFRTNPRAKILFVTALGEYKPLLENISQLFNGKSYEILSKPIRAPKLLALVHSLLNERTGRGKDAEDSRAAERGGAEGSPLPN